MRRKKCYRQTDRQQPRPNRGKRSPGQEGVEGIRGLVRRQGCLGHSEQQRCWRKWSWGSGQRPAAGLSSVVRCGQQWLPSLGFRGQIYSNSLTNVWKRFIFMCMRVYLCVLVPTEARRGHWFWPLELGTGKQTPSSSRVASPRNHWATSLASNWLRV